MPTIDWNKSTYDGNYSWHDGGDEWSRPWGGPVNQWQQTVLPRIPNLATAKNIVEIACGCGRWSHFLKDHCDNFVGVDLSEKAIGRCKERFNGLEHMSFYANDGTSLGMVADNSVDLVFSVDSLVHVEPHILKAYLQETHRVLKPDGVAILHHSNLGANRIYKKTIRLQRKILRLMRSKFGLRMHAPDPVHMRDPNVSAELVKELSDKIGLECLKQELTPWMGDHILIDCFSTLKKSTPQSDQSKPKIVINRNFKAETKTTA